MNIVAILDRAARVGGQAVVMTLVIGAMEASAQSVAGRVLDAVTGDPVADATVELRNQVGARLASAVTDREGLFRLAGRGGGEHRLEAQHLSYQTIRSEPFKLNHGEQLIVDLLIAPSPMQLDPLRVTGRRVDPRHEATLEGLRARAELAPSVGPARVIAGDDLRQYGGPQLKELLQWEMPLNRRGTCTVMYWNGYLVTSAMAARWWMETSVNHLEGVEFYWDQLSAPMAFRDIPSYLQHNVKCKVVAVWPRQS